MISQNEVDTTDDITVKQGKGVKKTKTTCTTTFKKNFVTYVGLVGNFK